MDRYMGRGSYTWLRPLIDRERQWTQRLYTALLEKLIAPDTRWLDAGCGHQLSDGWNIVEEQDVVKRAACVIGCDASLHSIRKHRSVNRKVVSTLEELPFQDGEFNLVTLNMVAEHLSNPKRALHEMARVLAPNGHLVVHTPNCAGYYMILMRVGKALLPRSAVLSLARFLEYREPEDVFPTSYRINTRKQLCDLMQEVGLLEEQVLLPTDRPLFYFVAPLCALELLATRTLDRCSLKQFVAPAILGIYRRNAMS